MFIYIGIYEIRQSKGMHQNNSLRKISTYKDYNSIDNNQKEPIPDIGGDDFSKSYSKGNLNYYIYIGLKSKILTR